MSRVSALSFRQRVKSAIGAAGQNSWLAPMIENRSVRRVLERIPGTGALYPQGWDRVHPFDLLHGTETSTPVSVENLSVSEAQREGAHFYAGSQPSVLREALLSLPALDGFTFIDIGCGKGRPLFIAREFPFREVIGVELCPVLAETARRNAGIVVKRAASRSPAIRIENADATTFPLPAGPLVLFLYNPFGEALIRKIVTNIEASLAAEPRAIYVIYYNPVYGACFDGSKALHRRFARNLPYSNEELGYGPDSSDPVVIWQPADDQRLPHTDGRIVTTIPRMRVEIETKEIPATT